jgi:hypothetical protein
VDYSINYKEIIQVRMLGKYRIYDNLVVKKEGEVILFSEHHTMKMHEGVDVGLHAFLTVVLDGVEL